MPNRKRKSVSDSRLMRLWREAVLVHWNYTDPIAKVYDPSGERLQCHHIIPRRHYLTRWDYLNGIPLTPESHAFAHTGSGAAKVRELVDAEYLDERERMLKKDWLRDNEMTDDEFRLMMLEGLQDIVESAPWF